MMVASPSLETTNPQKHCDTGMPISQPLNASINGGAVPVLQPPSSSPQQEHTPANSLFALAALHHQKFVNSQGLGLGAALDFSNLTAPSNAIDADAKLIDYRGEKVAAFDVDGHTMICLPQAYEIFLKSLVGGLHTVYTKLKRLDVTPRVCNVEQVRALRSLGAIQPGVNRCKLITCEDFDALYGDCTNNKSHGYGTSSRPGRPAKREGAPLQLQHQFQQQMPIGGIPNNTSAFLNALMAQQAQQQQQHNGKRAKMTTSEDGRSSSGMTNGSQQHPPPPPFMGLPPSAAHQFLMQQMMAAHAAATANGNNIFDMPNVQGEQGVQNGSPIGAGAQSDPLNLSKLTAPPAPTSSKSMNDVMNMLLANAQRGGGQVHHEDDECPSSPTSSIDDEVDGDVDAGNSSMNILNGPNLTPKCDTGLRDSMQQLTRELKVLKEQVATIVKLADSVDEKADSGQQSLLETLQQERAEKAVAQMQLAETRKEKKMFEKRWRHAKRAKEELHAQLLGFVDQKSIEKPSTDSPSSSPPPNIESNHPDEPSPILTPVTSSMS